MGKRVYKVVAVGGTFDHLHKGHKALLTKAFEVGQFVSIGVTSDSFARRVEGKELNNSKQVRVEHVKRFVEEVFPRRRYEIVLLEDFFASNVLMGEVEAVVVSPETAYRIREADRVRVARGLPQLKVEVVGMVLADDEKPISSTRIRLGEIDEEGHVIRR